MIKRLNSQMYFDFNRQPTPTRNGYGDALIELGKDKRIVALCADLKESTRVEDFAKKYPQRYIEMGVAEQNMITVASGLAAVGKIPFASSYAIFSPGRCWEQIRTTICYNDQNVKLIGSHAGVTVGADGATHQALEDLAITRCLPNMIVVVPADYEQTKKATKALAKFKGPCYMRFARNETEQMTTARTPFRIGKAQVWKQGKDLAIIAAGPVLHQCLIAAEKLEGKGIKVMVVNCHTIKPLDQGTILMAAKRCKKIITVEEAQIIGGLGSAVSEYLSEVYPVPVKRMGVRDKYGESGEPEELLKKFGLDSEHIYQECLKRV